MQILAYCPACGAEELYNGDVLQHNHSTVLNTTESGEDVICHYACACGNVLAGCMVLYSGTEYEKQATKQMIKDYNVGGLKYNDLLLKTAQEVADSYEVKNNI